MEMESEDGIEGRVRTRRAGRRRIQKRSRNPNLSQLLAGGPYPRSGIKSAPPAAPAPGTIGFGFPGATVGAIPFVFPFAPLGLGLFDADPQRLLTLLQHQSALAEEALRYRNLLFGTVGTAPPASSSPAPATGSGPEPDCKEGQPQQHHQLPKTTSAVAPNSSSTGTPPSTIRVRDGLTKEGYRNGMGGEELLLLRKLPIPASPEHHAPSSDSVVCDESLLAPFRETPGGGTERDVPPPGTKCHICMAHFPSVWLLEQHSALQHPHLTLHDDKPYQCGLCGQKSRYSCCRYRTVGLTKHHRPGGPGGLAETGVGGTTPTSRSRVPADKLFTCDVCGMQFRYLKSFKKHRLNHALERLHGKKGTVGALAPAAPAAAPAAAAAATVADSEPAVSSTNDGQPDGAPMMADAIAADLRGLLRDADALESADDSEQRQAVRDGGDEQDDTVSDSVAPVEQQHTVEVEVEAQPKITSSTSASSSSSSSSSSASSSSASSNSSSSSSSSSNTGGNATSTSITHLPTSTACNGVARALLDDSTPEQLKLHPYHHAQHQQHQQQPAYQRQHHQLHVPGSSSTLSTALDTMEAESSSAQQQQQQQQQHKSHSHTLNSLINAETIPHHRLLGLDPQEASILNFLRVDAAEKQRDRRFACPFCGKCVRSKENLKLHVRKHTGERPFVCLFCGRAFGGKSDLTRHLRIHTGERPYHCEACGKCFARADYLSKHLTTHVHQMSPRP